MTNISRSASTDEHEVASRKAGMQGFLQAHELCKEYEGKNRVVAIDSITFSIDQGDFASIVGPSGCGKTTLMRCLAGLVRPTRGKVTLKGREVTAPPEGAVMVFQDYSKSLLPWRTVLENVMLGLEVDGTLSKKERLERAHRYLDAVNISGFDKFYPRQLSGGMQQRVAIARALACHPEIVLMDEPFASVDAQTRGELQDVVRRVWKEFGQTILFVTHDIEEAIYLATKVVVIGARPSRVIDTFDVDLGLGRDQLETKEDHRFLELRHKVYSLIRAPRTGGAA